MQIFRVADSIISDNQAIWTLLYYDNLSECVCLTAQSLFVRFVGQVNWLIGRR